MFESNGNAASVARLAACSLLLVGAGCSRSPTSLPVSDSAAPTDVHPVVIRTPLGPPTIPTGALDEKGNPIRVGCATCHATKPPVPDVRLGSPMRLFHYGMVGQHANLSCTACHNPSDGYATLRLADGRSVPYTDVMTLCAQCHGPQFRDYHHGTHGGMTGYWDRAKGGRVRNNCIECHDPHAPKYPEVTPAPGPNDRFPPGGGHE